MSSGSRLVPNGNVRGLSISATAGSCTISLILDQTNSAAVSLASSLISRSRKVAANIKPPCSHEPSKAAVRSAGDSSSAEVTLPG